ncbi:MAG: hypothetical protein KKG99_04755 [Bacteroidetes bacterium]|nr:hypothetical protein [Bacteroidota bacterium]
MATICNNSKNICNIQRSCSSKKCTKQIENAKKLSHHCFRNLNKQKGYFVIHELGLAIGLTSFLFISLYVYNELTYDRINISPITFALATFVALLIGWLAISFQAIRVALKNPVEALKYE